MCVHCNKSNVKLTEVTENSTRDTFKWLEYFSANDNDWRRRRILYSVTDFILSICIFDGNTDTTVVAYCI